MKQRDCRGEEGAEGRAREGRAMAGRQSGERATADAECQARAPAACPQARDPAVEKQAASSRRCAASGRRGGRRPIGRARRAWWAAALPAFRPRVRRAQPPPGCARRGRRWHEALGRLRFACDGLSSSTCSTASTFRRRRRGLRFAGSRDVGRGARKSKERRLRPRGVAPLSARTSTRTGQSDRQNRSLVHRAPIA